MEKKRFKPNVKPAPNGFFKANVMLQSFSGSVGKIVMAEIIDEVEVRLLSNSSLVLYDKSWKPSSYNDGWYEKFALIDEITFFSFN